MEIDLVKIVLIIALVLNVLVSIFLLLRSDLDRIQKTGQIVIVWLIPFLGAIGLLIFNRSHDKNIGAEKKPFGGGANDGGGIAGDTSGGGE